MLADLSGGDIGHGYLGGPVFMSRFVVLWLCVIVAVCVTSAVAYAPPYVDPMDADSMELQRLFDGISKDLGNDAIDVFDEADADEEEDDELDGNAAGYHNDNVETFVSDEEFAQITANTVALPQNGPRTSYNWTGRLMKRGGVANQTWQERWINIRKEANANAFVMRWSDTQPNDNTVWKNSITLGAGWSWFICNGGTRSQPPTPGDVVVLVPGERSYYFQENAQAAADFATLKVALKEIYDGTWPLAQ